MAEEPKPVVAAPEATVEPTPTAAVEAPKTEEVTPAAEPATKTEEPAKTEAIAETTAPAKEKKEEKKEEKPAEPIYSGALGYKAPGLVNSFRFSKKYFWFGEEPVNTQSLSHFLRGEKPEVAHPTAAWSSQTGKGLVYFVKHADQKATPAGVLNLSEASDLSKDGTVQFHFKLNNHKHTFEASTGAERNGWFIALEKGIEEAKAKKDEIVGSEGYKEQLNKLGPATLASPAAKEGSTPKKSTDATPKPTETAAEASEPTRAGSASSSSDEDKKKSKKSKSRSVSRGKRASIFGGILGKKEKLEEKKEEKKAEKEEKKEEKKEESAEAKTEEPAAAAPVAEASTTAAPVITTDLPKKESELEKKEETPAIEAATEEKKTEEKKPKPTKRGSIFGSFVEKLKSPTTEKKESEVAPAPPAKEGEAAAEVPKTEEIPVAAATTAEASTEAPKTEEAKEAKETKPTATTPHKEKNFSFGKFLGGKDKAKSPTTETAPKVETKAEEPAKAEEAPVAEPTITEAGKEDKKEEAPIGVTSTASATPAPKQKRASIFGNLGGGSVKKEKEGEASEKKENKLTGLFRNASKAGRSKKEKEATPTPAKVEETAEPAETKAAEPAAAAAPKVEETPAEAKKETTEPNAIGDVVPDAVTVGQAPKSTPEVSATA